MKRNFHGTSVVYKRDPYIHDSNLFNEKDSLTEVELDLLIRMGYNVIILGVLWSAFESNKGNYN